MRRIILACAVAGILSVPAFGQQAVYPEEGIYQLNVAKSTFRGPGAKSQIVNVGKETYTLVGFDATGKPFSIVFPTLDKADGQSRPVTGTPIYDAQTTTQIDPYTVRSVRTKDGKVVQTLVRIYNPDSKTITTTVIGATGAYNHVLVYEKQ